MTDWRERHLLETFKGRITLSVEVLKTLVLINGGAAVAVLAFWGNTAKAGAGLNLSVPLTFFVFGLASAAVAGLKDHDADAASFDGYFTFITQAPRIDSESAREEFKCAILNGLDGHIGSRRNVVIVEAKTPQEARRLANIWNQFGEEYGIGFSVVALNAAIDACGGALVLNGNLATDPQFDRDAPYVF